MRRVVNSQQVAHLWANQSQSDARNGSGSVSFAGDTLYSYRTPIARVVDSVSGRRVALITCERYSATTSSRHMPAARSAVRHMQSFHVPSLGVYGGRHSWEPRATAGAAMAGVHACNLAHLVERYLALVETLRRMLSRPHRVDDALSGTWDEAVAYALAFGLQRPRRNVTADVAEIERVHDARELRRADPKYQAKLERARVRREERKAEQARAKREAYEKARQEYWERTRIANEEQAHAAAIEDAARMEEQARNAREWAEQRERERAEFAALYPAMVEEWRTGARAAFPSWRWDVGAPPADAEFDKLRISGDRAQTSRGAEVNIEHARRACAFVLALIRAGREWKRNGEQFAVGPFQLDSVSLDGVARVGCHTFRRDEIERFALLSDVTSDDTATA